MAPSSFLGIASGAGVMLSTPPATKTSPSPTLMARAAALTAARPDEQRRLDGNPGTDTGNPARSAALPATLPVASPARVAQPRYPFSPSAGATAPRPPPPRAAGR